MNFARYFDSLFLIKLKRLFYTAKPARNWSSLPKHFKSSVAETIHKNLDLGVQSFGPTCGQSFAHPSIEASSADDLRSGYSQMLFNLAPC